MTSPESPSDETPVPEGTAQPEGAGVLERLGAQIASLSSQVAEIDERIAHVESDTPGRPVQVELSSETVSQIAEALASLQAAGSQALDDAFKEATDDLIESLSGLVQAQISQTLEEAGYDVIVSAAPESDVSDIELTSSASTIVAPLASQPAEATQRAEAGHESLGEAASDVDDDGEVETDRPPLTLDELDDPFLDALIRKEPLSA